VEKDQGLFVFITIGKHSEEIDFEAFLVFIITDLFLTQNT